MKYGDRSSISADHVTAADHLRLLHDVAKYGFSVERDLSLPVQAAFYRPLSGPSSLAMQRLRTAREYARAMRLFTEKQAELIDWILFNNKTVRQFCRERLGDTTDGRVNTLRRRLIECLDMLVAHFDTEIKRHGPLAA